MSESLLSVGLDVGTTSTQLIVSRITAENRASPFAVPEMAITDREVIYRSPIHFTPLVNAELIDGEGVRRIVEAEYVNAGITPQDVDTGALIITGETSRKENARAVSQALSRFAGDFVVATAGPDLESRLAARGAGAVSYSERTGKTVLHMDIGGGTSNLALIENGEITATGCLNVGGRLLKFDEAGTVTYASPVLQGLADIRPGTRPSGQQLRQLADVLVQALEMAASLRQRTELLDKLTTRESGPMGKAVPPGTVISFSGGVADCIEKQHPDLAFGDIGPILGQTIRQSRLCAGTYMLGAETIRATVIGAGCHSTQLSGSTVFYRSVTLPMQNLRVIPATQSTLSTLRKRLEKQEETCVVSLPGMQSPSYDDIAGLADDLCQTFGERPVLVALEADMAKALGHALALRMPDSPILCIDRVKLGDNTYLDVGESVGTALRLVVKTLIFSN